MFTLKNQSLNNEHILPLIFKKHKKKTELICIKDYFFKKSTKKQEILFKLNSKVKK